MTMYDFITFLSVIGVLAFIIVGVLTMGYLIENKACYNKYAAYQPEYVGLMTGCMITVDEQRVPAESLRITM